MHDLLRDEPAARASCVVSWAGRPQQRMPKRRGGAIALVRSGKLDFAQSDRVAAVEPLIRAGAVVVGQHLIQEDDRAYEAFV